MSMLKICLIVSNEPAAGQLVIDNDTSSSGPFCRIIVQSSQCVPRVLLVCRSRTYLMKNGSWLNSLKFCYLLEFVILNKMCQCNLWRAVMTSQLNVYKNNINIKFVEKIDNCYSPLKI
ncbi:hypothetical protein PUN28_016925 [Cardiocondyla obscurior]|uniref:Ribosomal protein L14 n=1 Tax=Cardiocondyla obscurior TaxID=286306 RepID=A0AAW2ELV7_9HYME